MANPVFTDAGPATAMKHTSNLMHSSTKREDEAEQVDEADAMQVQTH